MKKVVAAIIRFYHNYLSRFKLRTCRFYPSCSQYAIEAIDFYGLLKGGWVSLKRILRCNPLSDGGYDPVNRQEE